MMVSGWMGLRLLAFERDGDSVMGWGEMMVWGNGLGIVKELV